jgi:hypothetical protein
VAKSTVKKKRVSNNPSGKKKVGFFNGELKDRWRAAFEYRIATLKKHILISCSEAMEQLRDDSGKCLFTDLDIKKNQWKLQRMFTQLEVKNFKEPTKGEHYIMLYEILYGTKIVITKGGVKVEVDLEPNEKVMIIREMLKMGGHYAPEKRELGGKDGKPIAVEFTFGDANLKPYIPDTKNRIAKYN